MPNFTLKGVDLSTFNNLSEANYSYIRENYGFAILRLGYGVDGTMDARVKEHYAALKDDLQIGFYYFSYAKNPDDAKKEACNALRMKREVCGGDQIGLGIWFDYEYDSDKTGRLSPQALRQAALNFCNIIFESGYISGIYLNLDFLKNRYPIGIRKELPIWLAAYTYEIPEPYVKDVVIWQQGQTEINGKRIDINTLDWQVLNRSGWNLVDRDNYWIYYENGVKKINGWKENMNGEWYYFRDGAMVYDELLEINNLTYAFSKEGHMLKTDPNGEGELI